MTNIPKPVPVALLRAAVAQIEAMNHDSGRDLLVEELKGAGAKIGEVPKGSGVLKITHLGVSCQSTAGIPNALTVWAQKARRAIMQEAV